MAKTKISLRSETVERLRELGKRGETDDEIIRRLIEQAFLQELNERSNRILRNDEFIPLDEL
ncbi:MAG: hypothetical protein ACE5JE_07135 [Thermoplasmata archaeon]